MKLEDVMTTGEAAELWGKSPISIKQLCTGVQGRGPRLEIDVECRKSGKMWLVTRQGMERLYGKLEE
ncbi:helix-turn-helix domain-containing protein [Veillonella montpellierensis]|uniref:helix-turn-helix domain-containing protein n=1 Tax=Veillonella montpellierensis TaxID=187328 RepID=UPI00040BA6C5|nr:helix-turn-helix domain-containing protein [Veillonella montpellierensis]